MDWQPIETLPDDASFNVLVAWQVAFRIEGENPTVARWWEYDTDPENPSATHWARFDDPNT